jgi:hypothetical protein
MAAAGLTLWLFTPVGRLMIVILVTALLPFAFTWNIGGGGEWRFTMHVYSIYLVAAVYAGTAAWRAIVHRPAWRDVRWHVPLVGALAMIAASFYIAMPWFVKREAIRAGEAVNIEAGPRDRAFFRRGWSEPHTDGAVTSRVSRTERAAVHFPLLQKRAHDIVLRLDPVAPDAQSRVTVLLNRQLLGRLNLSWNPERVGSYRLTLPAAWVRAGDNEIELIPDAMMTAGSADPRFGWLDPSARIGVRLWYLRVLE